MGFMALASSCFIIGAGCIHIACGVSVSSWVTERRINDDFNGTLYIALALRVTSPLERELFISAEKDKNCPVVCRSDMF
jgi:hypothetical protein